MGVPWKDAPTIGNLLGTRMVLNEFVAYSQLGQYAGHGVNAAAAVRPIDPKSFTIATFALCGFANFSSIGIQIGGIGALAPNRRHDLARRAGARCRPTLRHRQDVAIVASVDVRRQRSIYTCVQTSAAGSSRDAWSRAVACELAIVLGSGRLGDRREPPADAGTS